MASADLQSGSQALRDGWVFVQPSHSILSALWTAETFALWTKRDLVPDTWHRSAFSSILIWAVSPSCSRNPIELCCVSAGPENAHELKCLFHLNSWEETCPTCLYLRSDAETRHIVHPQNLIAYFLLFIDLLPVSFSYKHFHKHTHLVLCFTSGTWTALTHTHTHTANLLPVLCLTWLLK